MLKRFLLALTLLAATCSPLPADVLGGSGLIKDVALRCRELDIPLVIAYRLIQAESAWKVDARERDAYGGRSLGLLQLSEQYLPWFAVMFNGGKKINPWNPRENIRIGLHYLAWLERRSYSMAAALWSYNAGPGISRQGRATWRTLNYIQYIVGMPPRRQTR